MEKNKLVFSLVALGILIVASFVIAGSVLNRKVFYTTLCNESDSGIDYFNQGYMAGYFSDNSSTNTTYNVYWDYCAGNQTLVEYVCGQTFNPNSTSAAELTVDCGQVPNSTGYCVSGKCI